MSLLDVSGIENGINDEVKRRLGRGKGRNLGTSRRWMVGQGLDRKSNLCPNNVKAMSKVCPKNGHVEGLSHCRPSLVKALSNMCQVQDLLDRDWT